MKMGKAFARMTALVVIVTSLGAAQAQSPTAPPPAAASPPVNRITGAAPDASWQEEFAYTLGTQAYVHLFPWLYNSLLRWRWAENGPATVGKVPANTIQYQRVLADPSYKEGGRPNSDMLHTTGFLDLSHEPLILQVPDMGDRYYTFQLINFNSDNFGYIGTRATGNRAGTYALIGPNWKGTLPKGVQAVPPSQTPWILVGGRILVKGPDDLAAVHKLQDQIKLMTLSQYLAKDKANERGVPMPSYTPLPPIPRNSDPMADWKNINRALSENPMPAYDAQIAKMYAQIGIGPGVDVDKLSPDIKKGLMRARDAGAMIVTSGPANNVGRTFVNGWGMTPRNWGRTGPDGDYLKRSAQSLGGIAVHDAEENIYPATFRDNNGDLLSDTRKYELRFEKGQQPPVFSYWSVTAYDSAYGLVANPINRYTVGSLSENLKYGDDGSLTIYVQKDAPGGDKDRNWLPSGAGNFHLVLRAYLPKPEVLDGRWQPPPVRRVD
jgi:hypothetical protein